MKTKDKIKNYCKNNYKQWIRNSLITLLVICLTIPLQYALGVLKVRDENIFLMFVVSILIILIETKNILYGVVSSLIFVLSFNFFETEPYFSFKVNDPNYYISFLIFIILSLIVGTLVTKLQRQNKVAIENGNKVQAMYDLSSKLLDNHDKPFVYNFVVNFFNKNLKLDFSILDVDGNLYGNPIEDENYKEMLTTCLEKNIVIGKNTFTNKESQYLCFPIRSKTAQYGALFVKQDVEGLSDDQVEFIKKNILHLVVVLDRELAIKAEEYSKLAMEKEKFKTSLLRSLSHDLKTPLTSIQSGSDLILSSYEKLDDESIKGIVSDIYQESVSLNTFIVNLLNMSKLDEMKTIVNRTNQAIDDILGEVYHKSLKILNGKKLTIKQSEELALVYTEPTLLEQVLYNLVDNAVKHTKENTTIKIEYEVTNDDVIFNVIDNGGGIKEDYLNKIFEDFYSLTSKQDRARSNGLGLSICKAIVEAHGGSIKAYNNDIGGATFTFNIPNMESEAKKDE